MAIEEEETATEMVIEVEGMATEIREDQTIEVAHQIDLKVVEEDNIAKYLYF